MTFVIDADNNITAHTAGTAPSGAELKFNEQSFGSEKELATLAEVWSGARLIQIWNSLPGVTPVKKFTVRKSAVARIWKSIQSLVPLPEAEPSEIPAKLPTGKKSAKVAKVKAVEATEAEKFLIEPVESSS